MGIYLDENKKIFYKEAFDHVVTCKGDKFSKLENDLYRILKGINESEHYRTMYSQSRYQERKGVEMPESSYLTLCYTHEGESNLKKNIIPILRETLNQSRTGELIVFWNRYKSIKVDLLPKDDCLKYTESPGYFNIEHVKIELKKGGVQDHNSFWSLLREKLI